MPILFHVLFAISTPRRYACVIQAGLLTPGSFYWLRLPIYLWQTVACATFVPGYSGGPVLEFHEVPFEALVEHLKYLSV